MSNSIISIGQAAQLLQAMPSRISAAAVELCIEPAMRINCIDHFAEADLERIAEHLRLEVVHEADSPQEEA
ncbi:hypothetical protein [Lacipirellula sp.]|uniref:hypothetical protein n=1 Tax=Lacipirellula sp. TaxID=2691419 RepID=UPI003D12F6C5